ncbi:MAG: hypothetical protein HRT35_17565 [Algicola sp.]|nr:hypothetical protein [Algicola sp.]
MNKKTKLFAATFGLVFGVSLSASAFAWGQCEQDCLLEKYECDATTGTIMCERAFMNCLQFKCGSPVV